MVKIERSSEFEKNLKGVCKEHPSLLEVVNDKIKWFESNPDDTRLDNHPLRKRLEGRWAFSITNEIRIVYKWLGKTTVRFLAIGGHRKVYS